MDGEAIKLTRKRLQKTQAEMAADLKVSRQSYIAWEKDMYKMPPDKKALLISMDTSVPEGGLAPKKMSIRAKETLDSYRTMRAPPNEFTHGAILSLWTKSGYQLNDEEKLAIFEAFPDILKPQE